MCAALPMIKASSDFKSIAAEGRKWITPAFIVQVRPSPAFRLGLTASRKVGGAIIRNRAKRRLRETVRLYLKEKNIEGFEIVLIARAAAATQDFNKLAQDFVWALKKLEVLK